MLSRADIARIKADIEKLEKSRDSCADSGIRKQIELWIEQQKKNLGGKMTRVGGRRDGTQGSTQSQNCSEVQEKPLRRP
jgi:hypothetical protein